MILINSNDNLQVTIIYSVMFHLIASTFNGVYLLGSHIKYFPDNIITHLCSVYKCISIF